MFASAQDAKHEPAKVLAPYLDSNTFLAGSLDFAGIPRLLEAAVDRFGGGPDQAPDLDTLVVLDREVRAAYASGAVA